MSSMVMIKLLTIIGARPQIIKAAALSRAIREMPGRAEDYIRDYEEFLRFRK